MNRTFKVAKWQLQDVAKAIAIFYGVMIGVFLLITLLNTFSGSEQGKIGGLDFNETIFCFAFAIGSFANAFKFTQANNIPRRSLFGAWLISFTGVAVILAITSNIVGKILPHLLIYEGMLDQLYRIRPLAPPLMTRLLWNASLNAFAIFLGLLITMIYYRCNRLQKMLVSFTPAVLILVLTYLNGRTAGRAGAALIRFIGNALGFGDFLNPNPLIAAGTFALSAVVCATFCFLLLRRLSVRC